MRPSAAAGPFEDGATAAPAGDASPAACADPFGVGVGVAVAEGARTNAPEDTCWAGSASGAWPPRHGATATSATSATTATLNAVAIAGREGRVRRSVRG